MFIRYINKLSVSFFSQWRFHPYPRFFAWLGRGWAAIPVRVSIAVAIRITVALAHDSGRRAATGNHDAIDLDIESELIGVFDGYSQARQRNHHFHTKRIGRIQCRPGVATVGVFQRDLPAEPIVKPHHMDGPYRSQRTFTHIFGPVFIVRSEE